VEINPTKSDNLFQSEEDLLRKLNPQDRGPKTDKKGNIMKYTLVGSV